MQEPSIQIIEEGKTLSRCRIWPMIEEFYGNAGPDAWIETPFYCTSNAFIGESYAELIVAFLRDSYSLLDVNEPIYILELSAGLGVLGFFTLKALQEKLALYARLRDLDVRYVMTDFTQRNIDLWHSQPIFQPYLNDNKLDFALFWPEIETQLHLQHSRAVLDHTTVNNPLIAIANYFFDSIRHDFFQFRDGTLYESRPTLYRELTDVTDKTSPVLLAQIKFKDNFVPVSPDYYGDPEMDSLLHWYRDNVPEGSALFPLGAFRTLKNLRQLCQDRLCLISTDKGVHAIEALHGLIATPYVPHTGSFSYDVNFHALGMYFQNIGGASWHAFENRSITTMAAVSFDPEMFENLNAAAMTQLRSTNPINSLYQLAMIRNHTVFRDDSSPEERWHTAVACILLTRHDPHVFAVWAEHLITDLTVRNYRTYEILYDLLAAVEANCLPMAFNCQVALAHLRWIYLNLGDIEEYLRINAKICDLYGPEPDAFYTPAETEEANGNLAGALMIYQSALIYLPDQPRVIAEVDRLLSLIDV